MESDMLNKNPNNLSWKNKLEEVEGLSGETMLDKNTTWNKLYQRLQPKRRSIKALWYWAAAACLFIAMLFSWLTTSKKQPILVKIELPQAAQKINIVKVTSSQQPKKNMEIARC